MTNVGKIDQNATNVMEAVPSMKPKEWENKLEIFNSIFLEFRNTCETVDELALWCKCNWNMIYEAAVLQESKYWGRYYTKSLKTIPVLDDIRISVSWQKSIGGNINWLHEPDWWQEPDAETRYPGWEGSISFTYREPDGRKRNRLPAREIFKGMLMDVGLSMWYGAMGQNSKEPEPRPHHIKSFRYSLILWESDWPAMKKHREFAEMMGKLINPDDNYKDYL